MKTAALIALVLVVFAAGFAVGHTDTRTKTVVHASPGAGYGGSGYGNP